MIKIYFFSDPGDFLRLAGDGVEEGLGLVVARQWLQRIACAFRDKKAY